MDALIERLAGELVPSRPGLVHLRLAAGLGAGFAISLAFTAAVLGLRPDMPSAVSTASFWLKLAYTVLTAGATAALVARLTRPARRPGLAARWPAVPWLLVLLLALVELAPASASERNVMIFGGSATSCPWLIALLSLPPLAGLIWAARGLAPVRLRVTGFFLGVTAGATGASAYALHCTEGSAPFLAIWYALGVVAAAVIGLLLCPRMLRW